MSAAPALPASARAGGQPVPRWHVNLLPVALIAAIALTVLAAYWPTWSSMVAVWSRSQTFAHGFLVLPIAAWLLYRERHVLAGVRPVACGWGAVALTLCVLGWLVGSLVRADVVSQAAMMAMLPAAVLLILGPAMLRTAGFPLSFALLAVPAGEFLIPPLMDLTALGSVLLLRLSGVPVHQDGWLISIPRGQFQVAEACSGVRYLIGAATSGLLFAYLFFRSWKKRLSFMLFVAAATVAANVARAYLIILLAHLTDMRVAVGVDHFVYGWLMFSVLLVCMFAVGLRLADARLSSGGTRTGAPVFAPGLRERPLGHAAATIVAVALLMGGPALARTLSADASSVNIMLPVTVGEAALTRTLSRPRWLGPDIGWEGQHAGFAGGGLPFELHLFHAAPGPQGHDLAGLRGQLLAPAVTLVSDEPVRGAGEDRPDLRARMMRLQHEGDELLVAYWLRVGERSTANTVTAKLLEIGTMMAGEHQQPAMVAVVVNSKDLDQPGGPSLESIAAEVDTALSVCNDVGAAPSLSARCRDSTTSPILQGVKGN